MTTTWIGLSISTGLLLIAAGCEGFETKPINFANLLGKIAQLLS